jgi:hypothetical protein
LTVTIIGVGYDRSDGGSASALLRREQVDLQVGEARHTLDWAYRVAFVDRPCASWLCVQEPMSPRNINRNETNPSRETMFMQQQGDPVTWREFIDRVLGDETLTRITVTLRSTIDVSSNGRSTPMALVARCVVDVGAGRSNFLKQQFKTGANPRPTFWEPHCVSE